MYNKFLPKVVVKLEKKAKLIRKKILDMALRAGSGHIASAFSCVEILISLYQGGILRVKPGNPMYNKRDRFVLSKGHAAIALYAVLADYGFFPAESLESFACEEGCLGVHPERTTPGIEVSSGSLGHGLSIGSGLALGAKLNREKYSTVVLLGDGECQEGMVWEAAAFASRYRLNNLIAIIDYNRLSATDFVKGSASAKTESRKWEAFDWQSVIVDGHSFDKLLPVLHKIRASASCKPLVVIALTTKGKGVSFMENAPIWHYRVPVGNELKRTLREIG